MSSGWENAPLPPGLPPGHVPDRGTPPAVGRIPWEDPGAGSEPERFVRTFCDTFLDTSAFFEKVGDSEQLLRPFVYATLLAVVSAVATQVYDVILGSSITSILTALTSGRGTHPPSASALALGIGERVAIAAFTVAAYPIGLLLTAALIHVVLMMFGGVNRSLAVTARVVAYASAGHVLAVVPFVGSWVGGIVNLALQILGLARAHRTSLGKAAAAVLLPIAALCICLVAVVAVLAATIASLFKI